MTEEKRGTLLEAFVQYYWSVPVSFVAEKIAQWHPEVTAHQFGQVLSRCNENPFWHHCCTIEDVLEEPELVAEHLFAVVGCLHHIVHEQRRGMEHFLPIEPS